MLKPVSILTQLEDSPPTIDRGLLTAYFRTVYRVDEPPGFAFFPGAPVQPEAGEWLGRHKITNWAFLTAWNPRSIPLSPLENEHRNEQLALRILSGGWKYYSGIGIGADAGWTPERSFWIVNIPAEAAIRLGRAFDQNALVWWEKDKPVELWWL